MTPDPINTLFSSACLTFVKSLPLVDTQAAITKVCLSRDLFQFQLSTTNRHYLQLISKQKRPPCSTWFPIFFSMKHNNFVIWMIGTKIPLMSSIKKSYSCHHCHVFTNFLSNLLCLILDHKSPTKKSGKDVNTCDVCYISRCL